MWLLSKNREEDARKSLQWLRGWVSPKAVEKEFKEMQRYNKSAAQCTPCQKSQNSKCEHPPPSEWMKLQELMRKRNLRPFALVLFLFAFGQLSGLTGMRPYLVQIFQAYGVPLDANWATVSTALLGLAANVVCMVSIKFVGKRRLALFSFTLTSLSCLSLAIYAFNVFPPGWSSSDMHESVNTANGLNYLAMFLFFTLAFGTSVGVLPVPWILLSEVFPFKYSIMKLKLMVLIVIISFFYRNRSLACGITAAINYTMTFVTTKTYFNLESSLSLPGVILFYGICGLVGVLFVYFFLPETEKRTLEDIELYFSDNNRKLTDIHIERYHRNTEKAAAIADDLASKQKQGIDNTAYNESEK